VIFSSLTSISVAGEADGAYPPASGGGDGIAVPASGGAPRANLRVSITTAPSTREYRNEVRTIRSCRR